MTERQERIRAAIIKRPDARNCDIGKNFSQRASSAEIEIVRALMRGEDPIDAGVKLTGKRVLSRRPTETAAKFIKRLEANKGFDPAQLSIEWGIGEETIRRYAREMGCLKFVEVEEDEWKQLVLSPETAKQFDS
jgi:hypothetical protein